ncbi:Methyl-accepting chemotaxis protein 4 [Listeria grayi]|uniref:Methyl-accepting chemotaxis protein tlpA n=3 Tax=Listeria grayi TaxID=1641 RepID=A0A829R6T9_LISGR|nr:methyl-accepting chemotaxis protein [Listeria grayi]EUJ27475.1 Methyl-accepting chemotaxis protein tlpA [Listeria grayi FSL F6-1183]VEI35409.1 Methyl-accepting chemotaxis protein 4 [Listeria grayi]
MNIIKNRKLKTKLGLNIVINAIILIALGVTVYFGFNHVSSLSKQTVEDNVKPMREISTVKANMAQINIDILSMFDSTNEIPNFVKDIDDRYAENDKALVVIQKAGLGADEKKQLQLFKNNLAEMKDAASSVIRDTTSAQTDSELLNAQNNYYLHVKTKFDDAVGALNGLESMNFNQVNDSTNAISAFGNMLSISLAGAIILIVIVAVLFNLYMNKTILSGIRHLRESVRKIAAGDLSYQSENLVKDELGEIGHELNEMAENLRLMIIDMKETSAQVKNSSDNVIISSEIISQMTGEMGTEMRMMGEKIETQIGSMTESTEAMDQMTGGVQNVAEYSLKVSDLTKESVIKTNEGISVINNLVSQMDRISMVMRSSTEVVSKLVNRVGEVEVALNTVTNIADQTNLLALNAAIESARAGEHGRGFAVVAEEVRKLAEQSRLAVVDINAVLKKIQSESQTTVEVMNEGLSESEAGQKIIGETEVTFKDLLSRVNDIATQMQSVSQETEEMAAGIEEVNTSIADVTEISKQIGEQSKTSLEFAEINTFKINELVGVSEEMQHISSSLEGYVNRFVTDKLSEDIETEEQQLADPAAEEQLVAENI